MTNIPMIHFDKTGSFQTTKSACGCKGTGTYTRDGAFVTCNKCLEYMKSKGIENAGIAYSHERYDHLPNNN